MKRVQARAVLLVAAMTSAPAIAAEYLAFGERAREIARVVTSIQSCKRLGYEVDDRRQIPSELTDSALRTAAVLQVDRQTAEGMLSDALKREQEDMELMSSLPDHIDTRDELVARFRETMDFWNSRCAELATSELGSQYIRRGPRQAAAFQAMIDTSIRQIEGASSGN